MTLIDQRILIDAPSETVWQYIIDPEHIARWHAHYTAISLLSTNPMGVGVRRRCTLTGGKDVIEEITSWVNGIGYEYVYLDGGPYRSLRGRYRLQPQPDGISVQWTITYEPRGLIGRLRDLLRGRQQMTQMVSASLRQLRREIDQLGVRMDAEERARFGIHERLDAEQRAQYQRRHTPSTGLEHPVVVDQPPGEAAPEQEAPTADRPTPVESTPAEPAPASTEAAPPVETPVQPKPEPTPPTTDEAPAVTPPEAESPRSETAASEPVPEPVVDEPPAPSEQAEPPVAADEPDAPTPTDDIRRTAGEFAPVSPDTPAPDTSATSEPEAAAVETPAEAPAAPPDDEQPDEAAPPDKTEPPLHARPTPPHGTPAVQPSEPEPEPAAPEIAPPPPEQLAPPPARPSLGPPPPTREELSRPTPAHGIPSTGTPEPAEPPAEVDKTPPAPTLPRDDRSITRVPDDDSAGIPPQTPITDTGEISIWDVFGVARPSDLDEQALSDLIESVEAKRQTDEMERARLRKHRSSRVRTRQTRLGLRLRLVWRRMRVRIHPSRADDHAGAQKNSGA